MATVGRWVRKKIFGIDDAPAGTAATPQGGGPQTTTTVSPPKQTASEIAAERAAQTAVTVSHIEAQEAKRRRIKAEGAGGSFGRLSNASMFLANRGTRYSGLKLTLGG
jgi:hypothetical protein